MNMEAANSSIVLIFFLDDVKDMMNQKYQLHIPLPTLPLLQKTEKRGVSGGNKI